MNLNLTRACGNCPFRRQGAIDLMPGRLAQIVRDLLADDTTPFLCHKTVYGPKADGETIEHEDGTTTYCPGHRDSVCAGSMTWLLKAKSPNVAMRMGVALGMLDYASLERHADEILDVNEVIPVTGLDESRKESVDGLR